MDKMSVLITEDPEWFTEPFSVWIGLPGEDPLEETGFCIGSGATRQAAVAQAVAMLEAATDALQSPPGVVPERVI